MTHTIQLFQTLKLKNLQGVKERDVVEVLDSIFGATNMRLIRRVRACAGSGKSGHARVEGSVGQSLYRYHRARMQKSNILANIRVGHCLDFKSQSRELIN